MAQINLLDWRSLERKRKQGEFLSLLSFAAVITAVLGLLAHFHVVGLINYQQERNRYLENEIKIVDEKIKEIKELEATKKALVARMEVIEALQTTRPTIVHMFDEFVKTIPDGMYLTAVKQSGNKINIEGKAESNARVSAYMRNIEASEWLKNPNLGVIEAKDNQQTRMNDFKLVAEQTSPAEEEAAKQEQGG